MKKENRDEILQTIKVSENAELLTYLIEKKIRKSRSAAKFLLTHKQIKVNNKIVSQFNFQLEKGDTITIHKNNHQHDIKVLKGIKIIYEDDYLIVVDKAPRLLSIATDREKSETAYSIISSYLKRENPKARVFVLHRLDRDTSGLMIYAKSTDVQETLQRNWDNTILTRSYVAVIEGRLTPSEGTIISWLTENKNYVVFSSEKDNGGQKAITHYKTLKSSRKFSMIQLELETGRKNQIRVHMQYVGHPIIGDKKYGSKINPIKRMALHANELVFVHPVTNETMEFKSPIPEKMMLLVEKPAK